MFRFTEDAPEPPGHFRAPLGALSVNAVAEQVVAMAQRRGLTSSTSAKSATSASVATSKPLGTSVGFKVKAPASTPERGDNGNESAEKENRVNTAHPPVKRQSPSRSRTTTVTATPHLQPAHGSKPRPSDTCRVAAQSPGLDADGVGARHDGCKAATTVATAAADPGLKRGHGRAYNWNGYAPVRSRSPGISPISVVPPDNLAAARRSPRTQRKFTSPSRVLPRGGPVDPGIAATTSNKHALLLASKKRLVFPANSPLGPTPTCFSGASGKYVSSSVGHRVRAASPGELACKAKTPDKTWAKKIDIDEGTSKKPKMPSSARSARHVPMCAKASANAEASPPSRPVLPQRARLTETFTANHIALTSSVRSPRADVDVLRRLSPTALRRRASSPKIIQDADHIQRYTAVAQSWAERRKEALVDSRVARERGAFGHGKRPVLVPLPKFNPADRTAHLTRKPPIPRLFR
mmetsp:Transcript_8150/g.19692  ORF Transcript_8150/g.19692 Transcript_8150/m.19692 type:complete len:465 (-) Transcript_8150:668-2062(-)